MVTHDVALKNYANRVVRMVDGKVNVIETIPPEKRDENIRVLNELVEKHSSFKDKDNEEVNIEV